MYISLTKLAKSEGIDKKKLRELCESGKIDARRRGSGWQIDEESLEEYLGNAIEIDASIITRSPISANAVSSASISGNAVAVDDYGNFVPNEERFTKNITGKGDGVLYFERPKSIFFPYILKAILTFAVFAGVIVLALFFHRPIGMGIGWVMDWVKGFFSSMAMKGTFVLWLSIFLTTLALSMMSFIGAFIHGILTIDSFNSRKDKLTGIWMVLSMFCTSISTFGAITVCVLKFAGAIQ